MSVVLLAALASRYVVTRLSTACNADCESCGNIVRFKSKAAKDNGARLNSYVRRTIREFKASTDLARLSQVTDPAEFEVRERGWFVVISEGPTSRS